MTPATWLPRLGRRTVRSMLGIVALALVLSAFTTGYLRYRAEGQVLPQSEPPEARLSAAELSTYRAAANTPPGVADAPIVLAYHDIVVRPGDRHDVSREEFARQMAMLRAAGYRTLTGEEFVAVLRGAPSPPRSVLITFDDGTQGLWTYADRILARYGFHAVAFVITGHLDDRAGPYYLSWPEVRRMAASKRWTFGSHTRKSHREIPVSPRGSADSTGPVRSELVNRRWSAAGREPFPEFQRRVTADLRGSIDDLVSHGLPRPRLFAYPFSEASLPGQDPEALGYVLDLVSELFEAGFSSFSTSPEPAGVRTRARSPLIVDRLAVGRATSAWQLFTAMQRMRTLPERLAAPVAPDAVWSTPSGGPVPVRVDGERLTVRAPGTYLTTRYAAQATADWTGYRVSATVRGLDTPQVVTATLLARVGGDHPVQVRISARQVRVSIGPPGARAGPDGSSGGETVARLDPGDSHTVTVEVSPGRTVVTVDGVTRFDRASVDSALARGGIGIAVFRADTATPFPRFEAIRVTARS